MINAFGIKVSVGSVRGSFHLYALYTHGLRILMLVRPLVHKTGSTNCNLSPIHLHLAVLHIHQMCYEG